jgi:hypothetical protein
VLRGAKLLAYNVSDGVLVVVSYQRIALFSTTNRTDEWSIVCIIIDHGLWKEALYNAWISERSALWASRYMAVAWLRAIVNRLCI